MGEESTCYSKMNCNEISLPSLGSLTTKSALRMPYNPFKSSSIQKVTPNQVLTTVPFERERAVLTGVFH